MEETKNSKNSLNGVETVVKSEIVVLDSSVEATCEGKLLVGRDESTISICEDVTIRRLECENSDALHGFLGYFTWTAPRMTKYCALEARPGYATELAHEYEDEEEVLIAKVNVLANLIRQSKACVIYTGAGLSTVSVVLFLL
jgi:hypothetical protein